MSGGWEVHKNACKSAQYNRNSYGTDLVCEPGLATVRIEIRYLVASNYDILNGSRNIIKPKLSL